MKHLRKYHQLFESQQDLTPKQIDWLDDCVSGSWRVNPQTGLVDIEGDFNYESNVPNFNGVRFGDIGGDFKCSRSSLASLEGAPQSVSGNFYCSHNLLTSLNGAPQSVGGNFSCSHNSLTSLEGGPQSVGYIYQCDHNSLISLEGAPREIGWSFDCSNNKLTSLESGPLSISGDFDCSHNNISSLEGAPRTIKRDFNCNINQLTSLEGAPQTVDGDFDCEYNPVSESALKAIFDLMKGGKIYQQALERYWPKMSYEDRALMYKDNSSLTPEEVREYKALATYNNIKGYL